MDRIRLSRMACAVSRVDSHSLAPPPAGFQPAVYRKNFRKSCCENQKMIFARNPMRTAVSIALAAGGGVFLIPGHNTCKSGVMRSQGVRAML